MRLFVSYAHEDAPLVEALVEILRAGGHAPWFDDRLLPGQDWKAQLRSAIQRSDAFVYALTPASVASEWCRWEFVQAVRMGKPVIPVLLRQGTPLPEALAHFQYADFSQGATPHVVARLMGGLSNIAVTLPASRAPRAPENPAGLPALATREMQRIRARSRRRALLGLVAVLMFAAGLLAIRDPIRLLLMSAQVEAPTQSAAEYLEQGRAYRDQGDYAQAIAAYDAALAVDPTSIDAYLARAALYHALGGEADIAQSLADYSQAIALDPTSAAAYYLRGGVYQYALGDLERAIADYSTAIELHANRVEAYDARASAYAAHGSIDAAFADYEQALALDPNYTVVYYNRAGVYYYWQGAGDLALDDLNRAIEIDPVYVDAYLLRGQIHSDQGNYDQALDDFNTAINLAPDYAPSFYSRALLYYNAYADPDSALADLNMALELDGNYTAAYLALGQIHDNLGDVVAALENYEAYLSLAGDSPDPTAAARVEELRAQ